MTSSIQDISSKENMIDLYTDDAKMSEVKRIVKYQQDTDGTIKLVCVNIGVGVIGSLAGAGVGAGIGAALGGGIGFCIGSMPGLIGGAILGAQIGGIGGAVVGATAAVYWKTIRIKESQAFQQWKIKAVQEKVYPIFQRYVIEQNMGDFQCPISHSMMMVPVKAPNGIIYEREEIVTWIKSANETNKKKLDDFAHGRTKDIQLTPQCPNRSCFFQEKDLVYDQQTVCKIYQMAKLMMKKDFKQMQKDLGEMAEPVRKGFYNITLTIGENTSLIAKQKTSQVIDDFKDNGDKDTAVERFKNILTESDLERKDDSTDCTGCDDRKENK